MKYTKPKILPLIISQSNNFDILKSTQILGLKLLMLILECHFKACFFFFVTVPVAGDTQKSSSHFHCLKCDYYCTDTNKVVAHRRQHQKLDSIMAAGFEKFTPTQFCPVGGCPHNGKQTHYHCSKCQYAVLGLSQMEGHKYRHMNEWNAHYATKWGHPNGVTLVDPP